MIEIQTLNDRRIGEKWNGSAHNLNLESNHSTCITLLYAIHMLQI